MRVFKVFLQEHFWLTMLVLLFFIIGVALGIFSEDRLAMDQQTDLKIFLEQNCQTLISQPLDRSALIWPAVLGNVGTAATLWFLGLTVIGVPIVILIIVIRGFILGFTMSFLLKQYSLQGGVLIALGVLPQNLLYVPALLLGGVLAIAFSLYLIRRRAASPGSLWGWLLSYTLSMLLVAVCLVLAALVEGMVGPALLRVFIPLVK